MASLLLDFPCSVSGSAKVVNLAWCSVEAICAVATADNRVSFFVEEGGCLEEAKFSRQCEATALTWHPKSKIIAVGWADGQVSVWAVRTASDCRFAYEGKRSPIRACEWSRSATRLITCDAAGTVIVWKADSRGGLSELREYAVHSEVTRVALATDSSFFVGTKSGAVWIADDVGNVAEVASVGSAVDHLLFYDAKRRCVVLTRKCAMVQLEILTDKRVVTVMKMKVSIAKDGTIKDVCWAAPGVLAAATGESVVRFWNVASDETYVLNFGSGRKSASIAFQPLQRYLAVGSTDGKVVVWRFVGDYATASASADWEALPASPACGGAAAIDMLAWGPGQGMLAAAAQASGAVSVLSETVLHRLLHDDVGAIQLTTEAVRLERQNGASATLTMDMSIRGLAVSSHHVVAWNGQEARVYEWTGDDDHHPRSVSSFKTTAAALTIHDETVIRTAPSLVELCNLQGVRKQKIAFSDGEGSPSHLDLNGKFLAVATDTGLLKVFQIGDRREPKLLCSGRFDVSSSSIRSIKVNADGTRVSVLADKVHGATLRIREPDSRLFVYDSDRDMVDAYDFAPARRCPVSHFWDPLEAKLLACETRALFTRRSQDRNKAPENIAPAYSSLGLSSDNIERLPHNKAVVEKARQDESQSVVEVTTLFVTSDYGMLLQDVFGLEAPLEALLGVRVPRLYFTRSGGTESSAGETSSTGDESSGVGLCSRVMRDFVGIDEADEATRSALLNFSFYMTVGNMDEAHRAVRLIKSASVWENMAHMCVKTKRLDVAEACLGNMGHARGSAAVRLAKDAAPEPEARLAAVAIQLGLRNDAARLYRDCGRYDLLNDLYQAAGEWALALETAEQHDRIHLRSTHHRYAQHLESLAQYDAAAYHFERADTHRREVPRMLVAKGEHAALERYVHRSDKDSALLEWWAGYCESLGHLESARTCYEKARDAFNVVRVACLENDLSTAAAVLDETKDAAGSYHLARHLEGEGRVPEAIQYFARSGCYTHAIRLAKDHGLDTELMQFSLRARPSLQIDCAAYFERKGDFEKAVQLYQKGGDLPKALDLCFQVAGPGRAELLDLLAQVAKNAAADNASPEVLAKCADFLRDNGQDLEAVNLLIECSNYADAVALCRDKRIPITDELADRLTPPSSFEDRTALILDLARALESQQRYQFACKKFTQAGDKTRALKCLLKSGDTKNVVYYASMSRNRDIYILAANYLQSLDWQSGTESATQLTKKIVDFYTKAKAFEQLAGFYDAYAQMEIDEYSDYDKALGALKESQNQLQKASRLQDKDRRLVALDKRIRLVGDFVEARKATDPDAMVELCTKLIDDRDVDAAIRVGDAFALLVEHYAKLADFQQAYSLIEQMRRRKIGLHPYLEPDLLNKIHSAVGADLPSDESKRDAPDDDDDDIVDESPAVPDDDDDDDYLHK